MLQQYIFPQQQPSPVQATAGPSDWRNTSEQRGPALWKARKAPLVADRGARNRAESFWRGRYETDTQWTA